MPLSAPQRTAPPHEREIEQIVRTLRERGATRRRDLLRAVGARQWGPGRFGESLRAAQEQGQARRVARARYEATTPEGSSPDRDPSLAVSGGDERPPDRMTRGQPRDATTK